MTRVTVRSAAALTSTLLALSALLLIAVPASAADCAATSLTDPTVTAVCSPGGADGTDMPIDVIMEPLPVDAEPIAVTAGEPCGDAVDAAQDCTLNPIMYQSGIGIVEDCFETDDTCRYKGMQTLTVTSTAPSTAWYAPEQHRNRSDFLILLVGIALGAAGFQVSRDRRADEQFR